MLKEQAILSSSFPYYKVLLFFVTLCIPFCIGKPTVSFLTEALF